MSSPSIDPGAMVDGVTDAVTAGINDNLGAIALLAGGIAAIGVVWRLVRKAA